MDNFLESVAPDQLVDILIGTNTSIPSKFRVSAQLLNNVSGVLAANVLDARSKAESEGFGDRLTISYPDDKIETWKLLLFWIYHKRLPMGEEHDEDISVLIDAWMLGHSVATPSFQDAVMLSLLEWHGAIEADALGHLCETVDPGNPVARFLGEEVIHRMKVEGIDESSIKFMFRKWDRDEESNESDEDEEDARSGKGGDEESDESGEEEQDAESREDEDAMDDAEVEDFLTEDPGRIDLLAVAGLSAECRKAQARFQQHGWSLFDRFGRGRYEGRQWWMEFMVSAEVKQEKVYAGADGPGTSSYRKETLEERFNRVCDEDDIRTEAEGETGRGRSDVEVDAEESGKEEESSNGGRDHSDDRAHDLGCERRERGDGAMFSSLP